MVDNKLTKDSVKQVWPQISKLTAFFTVPDKYTSLKCEHVTCEIRYIKTNTPQALSRIQGFFTCFSSALEATYPEINHPVVQLGVLVDCGSAFLRAQTKNIITSPKNPPTMKYSTM